MRAWAERFPRRIAAGVDWPYAAAALVGLAGIAALAATVAPWITVLVALLALQIGVWRQSDRRRLAIVAGLPPRRPRHTRRRTRHLWTHRRSVRSERRCAEPLFPAGLHRACLGRADADGVLRDGSSRDRAVGSQAATRHRRTRPAAHVPGDEEGRDRLRSGAGSGGTAPCGAVRARKPTERRPHDRARQRLDEGLLTSSSGETRRRPGRVAFPRCSASCSSASATSAARRPPRR